MSDDLNTRFETAVVESKQLNEKPAPPTLLKLYSLYKQATVGDNSEEKPGMTDIVAHAKWNAWDELKGVAADDARQRYIDLVEELKAAQ